MRFVLRMNYGEDVIWLLQDKECEIEFGSYTACILAFWNIIVSIK